jgi:hypothetical protein
MVNIIWNTIVDIADAAATFTSNIWNLVSLNWENDSNNWED